MKKILIVIILLVVIGGGSLMFLQLANLVPEEERIFIEVPKLLQEGKKTEAIEMLNEAIKTSKTTDVLAGLHLYLGVLYRDRHLDDEKAKEHCKIGLELDAKVKIKDYLTKDSKGNTGADLCRMILEGK